MMFAASRFGMAQFAKTAHKYHRLRTPGGSRCLEIIS